MFFVGGFSDYIETVQFKNAQSEFLKFHKIILKRIKVYQIDRINGLFDNRNFFYLQFYKEE
jgi:hypothetical protein